MIIDGDKLKRDLMDYYGSATPFYPAAFLDVSRVENATPEELLDIANSNNVDLSSYEIKSKVKRYK
ncbi:MAG: hypothetical protein II119_03390 [Bacilli bacterium]|nr:hypothetical protein [Bacilli bacterium]